MEAAEFRRLPSSSYPAPPRLIRDLPRSLSARRPEGLRLRRRNIVFDALDLSQLADPQSNMDVSPLSGIADRMSNSPQASDPMDFANVVGQEMWRLLALRADHGHAGVYDLR